MDRTIIIKDYPNISILGTDVNFEYSLDLINHDDGVRTYRFGIRSDQMASPEPVTLRWRLPFVNMNGVWKSGGLHDKRQQYDWELNHLKSRVSVDAPVISVFGHDDANRITFACSDAINMVEMNALLREEDNHQYCHFTFFNERHPEILEYETEIRIDTRDIPYFETLQEVSKWWETFEASAPASVPDLAREPLYSTWYNFHQDLNEKKLLEEVKLAVDVGYKLLILDDGWQTMDTKRGYDFTGDWRPDRFPNLAEFVKKVQSLGMKFGLWYSVPFCGKKSQAYQRFKGKFLTENHRWAPVFDPRFPDVRQYLIDTYTQALVDWDMDAFKLDFIDDFKVYPETVLTKEDGRDFANVNEAVDKLLSDVMQSLKTIKPDIAIEFRQQYVGPVMRKFGNMFRAFDCPNDPVSNRIRITDVKLLCGNSAVHSDMITWHKDETVELAALQVINALFSVPQMSVLQTDLDKEFIEMLRFYTQYWTMNREVFLDGKFEAKNPLGNYPILRSSLGEKTIISIHDDLVATLPQSKKIDIVNGTQNDHLAVRFLNLGGTYRIKVYDCKGKLYREREIDVNTKVVSFDVPRSGIVMLEEK